MRTLTQFIHTAGDNCAHDSRGVDDEHDTSRPCFECSASSACVSSYTATAFAGWPLRDRNWKLESHGRSAASARLQREPTTSDDGALAHPSNAEARRGAARRGVGVEAPAVVLDDREHHAAAALDAHAHALRSG